MGLSIEMCFSMLAFMSKVIFSADISQTHDKALRPNVANKALDDARWSQ